MTKHILRTVLFVAVALIQVSGLYAATITSTTSGGTWSSTGTWVGGVVPGSGDAVIIATGATITVTSSTSCASLSFGTSNLVVTANLVVNSGVTLTVTGAVAAPVNPAVTILRNDCTWNISGLGSLTCASMTIGSQTSPSANATSTIYLNSSISSLSVSGTVTLYARVGNAKSNNPILDIAQGNVTINGTITTNNQNGSTSTIRMTTSPQTGVLSLGGATPFSLSNNGTNVITFNGTSATVNYSGAAQAVLGTTYTNLTLSGSGAKSISTATIVNGTLSMEGTSTAAITGSMLTLGAASTLQYMGSSSQTTGAEFISPFPGSGGVKINNANGVTLTAAKSLGTNPLTIGNTVANSIFHDGGYQLTATGTLNLTSGTLKLGASTATTFPGFATRNIASGTTVEYAASVAQTVKGASGLNGFTYSNLKISGTGSKTADNDITVNGVLDLSVANASDIHGALEMATSYGTYPGITPTDYASLSSYTLYMGPNSSTIGPGDVTGIVKRSHTIVANTPYTFGNQYTTVFISDGTTMPSALSVTIRIGAAPTGKSGAVKRSYEIVPTGGSGSGSKVSANFHYLDSEITGTSNQESSLVTWDYDISATYPGTPPPSLTPDEHGRAVYDFSYNYIGLSGVTIDYFIWVTTAHEWRTIFELGNFDEDYYTWNGSVNTVWTEPGNWTLSKGGSGAPNYKSHVIIPETVTDPVLPNGTTKVNTIQILEGGRLVMGSNTLKIENSLSGGWEDQNTSGNDPGTSTVIFNRPGSTISGNAWFYKVEIDAIDATTDTIADVTNQVGSAIRIGHSVSRTGLGTGRWFAATFDNTVQYEGTADQTILNPDGDGYHNLVFTSGFAGTIAWPSTMNVAGNLTNYKSGLSIGNTVVLRSVGHSQTIAGDYSIAFNNLTVNSAGVSLSKDQSVSGTLTLSNGLVTTGSNILTVGSAGIVSGGSSSSYVDGKLAEGFSGAESRTFPIGKGGNYRPVIINYTSLTGTGTVTAEQFESTLPGSLPSNTSLYGGRYWSVTGTTTGTYTVTLDGTGYTPTSGHTRKIINGNGSTNSSNTATGTDPVYTYAGLTSLGNFGVGQSDIATTIVAANITAAFGGTSVTLSATVTPDPGGGSVTFTVNGTTVAGTATVGTSGVAIKTYDPSALPLGDYVIAASFAGNGDYLPSNSDPAYNGTLSITTLLTWTGNTSTDWNTSTNWNPNGTPGANNSVEIGASKTVVIDQGYAEPAVCENMTIGNGSQVTINAGKALTVSGNLTNTGTLTIESSSGGSGSLIVMGTSSGNVVYNRSMTARAADNGTTYIWHLISFPVSEYLSTFYAANSSKIPLNGTMIGLAMYNESTNEWNHYTTSPPGTAYSGKGFEVAANTNATGYASMQFNGTLVSDANITATRNAAAYHGWNLVGNPFTSYMSTSGFMDANSADIASTHFGLWYWDPSNTYTFVNYTTGLANLAPCQGFFVKASANNVSITMPSGLRNHSYEDFKSTMTWPVIDLKAQVSALNSHALIKYIPGTTMGLDPGFDGGTFELNTGFTVYTRLLDENPVNYYIQCLPPNEYETLVVPVGLKAAAGKEVVLSLTSQGLPMGMKVYLEDRLLAKFVRLDEFGTSYKVTIPASGSETGRFFIHTTQGTLGIDEDIVDKILVIAFPGENRIRIKGIIDPGSRMSIFDLGGRILKSEILQYPNDNEIEFAAGTNGIYIIQVQSQGKTFQQKLNWVR